jgi:hypothetical protein
VSFLLSACFIGEIYKRISKKFDLRNVKYTLRVIFKLVWHKCNLYFTRNSNISLISFSLKRLELQIIGTQRKMYITQLNSFMENGFHIVTIQQQVKGKGNLFIVFN